MTIVKSFTLFFIAWLLSGFILECQIVHNLNKSGHSTLIFYSITVVEKPTVN